MKADAAGIGFLFFERVIICTFYYYLVESACHAKIVQYTARFVEMSIGRTSLE